MNLSYQQNDFWKLLCWFLSFCLESALKWSKHVFHSYNSCVIFVSRTLSFDLFILVYMSSPYLLYFLTFQEQWEWCNWDRGQIVVGTCTFPLLQLIFCLFGFCFSLSFSLSLISYIFTFKEQWDWCTQIESKLGVVLELPVADLDHSLSILVHVELFQEEAPVHWVQGLPL